jgi:hypothetical protein
MAFKAALMARFDATDDGPVTKFVGIDITRDEYTTHISQTPLVKSILKDFDMQDCNPILTPMEPNTLLTAHGPDDPQGHVNQESYQHLVGTLLYLAVWTRPDIVFAVHQLAKWSHDPHEKHMIAGKRVLKYLKGTKEIGITYTRGGPNPNRLLGWADADWAACKATRRSTSGYISTMNGGAISWKCRQQKSVATSTSEAEYVAASRASDDIMFLRRVLEEAGSKQTTPTPLYEDNRGCRMMSENPIANDRSKHIDYRVHALRERVNDGIVRLIDCATEDMLADIFTKNLPAPTFRRHRAVMSGKESHTSPKLPDDLTVPGSRMTLPKVAALSCKHRRLERNAFQKW